MLGSTRSGGRWPSMKVRMLMITFSPMSTRPSSVAEPICGSSTTLPVRASLTSFGLTAGSCSNTSSPAPAISPLSINRASAFSSMTSPRAVLTIGLRTDQLEPPGREQVIGRRRVWTIHRDDVHAGEHLIEALPVIGIELFLDARRKPAAVVIVDLQTEGAGPARHGLADAAHADDAEPLAPDALAEHPGRCPSRPILVAGQHLGALGEPP